jgi:hypothetical protein
MKKTTVFFRSFRFLMLFFNITASDDLCIVYYDQRVFQIVFDEFNGLGNPFTFDVDYEQVPVAVLPLALYFR